MYIKQRMIHCMLPFVSQSITYGVLFNCTGNEDNNTYQGSETCRHTEALSSALILFMKTDLDFISACS